MCVCCCWIYHIVNQIEMTYRKWWPGMMKCIKWDFFSAPLISCFFFVVLALGRIYRLINKKPATMKLTKQTHISLTFARRRKKRLKNKQPNFHNVLHIISLFFALFFHCFLGARAVLFCFFRPVIITSEWSKVVCKIFILLFYALYYFASFLALAYSKKKTNLVECMNKRCSRAANGWMLLCSIFLFAGL